MLTIQSNTERQEHFASVYPSCLLSYETYTGVDSETATIPEWWLGVPGFAAFLQNFIAILHDVESQSEPVLFFEDDCTFADDFETKFNALIDNVPDDYDVINLCPTHLSPSIYTPQLLPNNVLRIKSSTCTSSLIIKPTGATKMINCLSETNWKCRHVPDNQLALGMLRGDFQSYGPLTPICGQMGGQSTGNHDIIWPEFWTPEGFEYLDLDGQQQYQDRTEITEATE